MPDRTRTLNGVKTTVRTTEASADWCSQFVDLILGRNENPGDARNVAGAMEDAGYDSEPHESE